MTHATDPFDASEETYLYCIEQLRESHKSGAKLLERKLAEFRQERRTQELRNERAEILRSYMPGKGCFRTNKPAGNALTRHLRRFGGPREWLEDFLAIAFTGIVVFIGLIFAAAFIPIGY